MTIDTFLTQAQFVPDRDTHLTASGRTAWVIRHQKGSTSLGFTEARDDRVAVASAGPYANHFHLAADR